jgi:hypothetical protein
VNGTEDAVQQVYRTAYCAIRATPDLLAIPNSDEVIDVDQSRYRAKTVLEVRRSTRTLPRGGARTQCQQDQW